MSDTVSITNARGGGGFEPTKREELARFVAYMAETGDVISSASRAGITERTSRNWTNQPEVIAAIHSERERIIRTKGASTALKVLLEMVETEKTPAHTRLNAARELLALAGHSAAQAATDAAAGRTAAALQDMSADQLERMIAGAAATLHQLRRQATTIDVAPDPAPVPPDPASLL